MSRPPVDRDFIVAEIRRCADENDGTPLGRARFEAVTGIRESDWSGRFWARWSDAVAEAGFVPNTLQGSYPNSEILEQLATFVRELGRIPTAPELRMRRRQDSAFPSAGVFARLGNRAQLVALLLDYCSTDPALADVHAICVPLVEQQETSDEPENPASPRTLGYVYMVKSGKHYKIGQTTDLGRRTYELKLQLPERVELVHSIETDDPTGIERYWHSRFADRRANGEWFELSKSDVAAFKARRQFM